MTRNLESAAEDFAADMASLRHDVARLAEAMSKLVQDQTQAAVSRVSAVAADTADNIASKAGDAQNRVRAGGREVEAVIGRNPVATVLVSLGVGTLVGLISGLRD
jgi:ElaB/YqjD/DUF883 family membrane-anchored ribosome-binding protein